MLKTANYECPYCGEDAQEPGGRPVRWRSEYIEDCQVCCKPIRFVLQVHGEE